MDSVALFHEKPQIEENKQSDCTKAATAAITGLKRDLNQSFGLAVLKSTTVTALSKFHLLKKCKKKKNLSVLLLE